MPFPPAAEREALPFPPTRRESTSFPPVEPAPMASRRESWHRDFADDQGDPRQPEPFAAVHDPEPFAAPADPPWSRASRHEADDRGAQGDLPVLPRRTPADPTSFPQPQEPDPAPMQPPAPAVIYPPTAPSPEPAYPGARDEGYPGARDDVYPGARDEPAAGERGLFPADPPSDRPAVPSLFAMPASEEARRPAAPYESPFDNGDRGAQGAPYEPAGPNSYDDRPAFGGHAAVEHDRHEPAAAHFGAQVPQQRPPAEPSSADGPAQPPATTRAVSASASVPAASRVNPAESAPSLPQAMAAPRSRVYGSPAQPAEQDPAAQAGHAPSSPAGPPPFPPVEQSPFPPAGPPPFAAQAPTFPPAAARRQSGPDAPAGPPERPGAFRSMDGGRGPDVSEQRPELDQSGRHPGEPVHQGGYPGANGFPVEQPDRTRPGGFAPYGEPTGAGRAAPPSGRVAGAASVPPSAPANFAPGGYPAAPAGPAAPPNGYPMGPPEPNGYPMGPPEQPHLAGSPVGPPSGARPTGQVSGPGIPFGPPPGQQPGGAPYGQPGGPAPHEWDAGDQGRFDQFRPEPPPLQTEADADLEPVPQVRNGRVLVMVLAGAALLLVVPFVIVWLLTAPGLRRRVPESAPVSSSPAPKRSLRNATPRERSRSCRRSAPRRTARTRTSRPRCCPTKRATSGCSA